MKNHFSLLAIILGFIIPSFLVSSCKETDSKIQAAVDSSLKDNNMPEISASVKNGVVTLVGECKDETAKSSVESTVAKIKGVKQVINNCTVAQVASPAPVVITPDDALTRA